MMFKMTFKIVKPTRGNFTKQMNVTQHNTFQKQPINNLPIANLILIQEQAQESTTQ